MERNTKPLYAELLERAAHNFRSGYLNTARTLAADAIDEMVPRFSPNNPKLADAYRLHARICLTHFIAAGYELDRIVYSPSQARTAGAKIDAHGLYCSWRKSAAAEIEVLALGMETERLAQAKFDFACLTTHEGGASKNKILEAAQMKARLRDYSIDDAYLELADKLCETTIKLGDKADAMEVGSLTG